MQQNKGESLSVLAGNLSDLLEQAAGDNENMAQLAKILAIAEVSIAQGVAIAKAAETATRSSATWIDMLCCDRYRSGICNYCYGKGYEIGEKC